MNPLVDGIKERLNNSFSGPFSLIFIIWNWQIILNIFTGSDSAGTRIYNIVNYINIFTFEFILYPLLCTFFYIILMPIITSMIEYFNKRIENIKKNKLQELNLKTNETNEYKKILREKLLGQILNRVNHIETEPSGIKEDIPKIKIFIDALLEKNNMTIQQHYEHLIKNNIIPRNH